jgi:hypothetical protein
MKSILTSALLLATITAFSQVPLAKKTGGTSVDKIMEPFPKGLQYPQDTTITVKITSKVSFDTTKVVVELLGDDGSEFLQPVYKRAYVIRKILSPSDGQQPRIEWSKLYDDKWAILNYTNSEAKAITPFEWKRK